MDSDNFRVVVNGRIFLAKYKQRDGDRDAAGFGYALIDEKSSKSVGYLRVLIYGTASSMWANNTKYPYSESVDAEKTVKTAIKSVLSSYSFEINNDYFEAMSYRGDNITVQVTTLDDAVSPNEALITMKSYSTPEDFVHNHLIGEDRSSAKVRQVILEKIDQWESLHYGLPYGTRELQEELFLDKLTVHRAVDYLSSAGLNYISKSPAGKDEYNVKLGYAGVDYLEAISTTGGDGAPANNRIDMNTPILQALAKLNKSFADSYLQVLEDINTNSRKSWKGTANELRELVSSVLHMLAPDDEVIAQYWYKQEPNTGGPTQRQRVKYVLTKRNAGSKQVETMKELEGFDERIGTIGRKLYDRASNSAHQYSERKEIIRLYHYFVAFMSDLLDAE